MSRYVRRSSGVESNTCEGKFEASLRKYERPPTKRVKCDMTYVPPQQYVRKVDSSPFRQGLSRSRLSVAQENSQEKPEERASETKTIRLSKKKVLE